MRRINLRKDAEAMDEAREPPYVHLLPQPARLPRFPDTRARSAADLPSCVGLSPLGSVTLRGRQSFFSPYFMDSGGAVPPRSSQAKAMAVHLRKLAQAMEDHGWTGTEQASGALPCMRCV
jgi:hypothetical protein